MDFGGFLNSYVTDSQNFWTAALAVFTFLVLFGWRYNRWMDELGEKKAGYTAMLVAGGTIITLLGVAVISWKAAVLTLGAFVADGLFMLVGDAQRHIRQREKEARRRRSAPRRKPLPYAAAGLVDDALMATSEAQRALKRIVDSEGMDMAEMIRHVAVANLELSSVVMKLWEVKNIRD